MEGFHPKYQLLFLILAIIGCGINIVTGQYETNYCCDDNNNENEDINESTKQLKLLPLIENRVRLPHEIEWNKSIPKPKSTCIRSLLVPIATLTSPSLNNTASTINEEKHHIDENSNRNLLRCDNVTFNFINNFLLSPDLNRNTLDRLSKTNADNLTENRTIYSAIILSNIQQERENNNNNGHWLWSTGKKINDQKNVVTIDENSTEYLTWIKSELSSDTVLAFTQRYASANKVFTKLIYLDFSDNQITNLTWQMFECVPNVQILNLSANKITNEHIQIDVFQQFKKLHRLDLSKNELVSIVHGQDMDSMQLLNSNLLGVFQNLSQLIELDLSYNQIADLPRNAFNDLPKLISLNLAHNQLTIIPFQIFDSLKSIEQLDLSQNRLVSFPDNFFISNNALRVLNLRNNTIVKLTKNSLHGLERLTYLDLSDNQLKTIDRNAFDSLTMLQMLNLCRNNLTILPTTLFHQLHQLKYVNLSRNNFQILPNGIFASQYRLEELIIDETGIMKLSNWVSRQHDVINKDILSNLKLISIRNNRHLHNIDPILFRNTPAVQFLNLSGNSLTTLPHEIGELTELKRLDISRNDLISIPKQLNTLEHLRSISLIGNNYACDCQMAWLVSWIDDIKQKMNITEMISDFTQYSAPLNQLKRLKCRHGYPGDFLRVLQQLHCVKPTAVHVSESKTYLLRSDAQLECSFSGNPVPDVIWVTPLNKVIRYHADPDAKPFILMEASSRNINSSNSSHNTDINIDLEHQAKNKEKIEYQILKQKRVTFTAAIEANGVTLLENGSLRVHNISRKDSGLYTCYGYNIMGYATAEIRYIIFRI